MNKTIKDVGGVLLGAICALVFFYLEFGGIYHAFKKHGNTDGWVAVCIPPYSFYRSVEVFWHDDFKGLDWEKQLGYDFQTCIGFIKANIEKDPEIMSRMGEAISHFSQRIKKYPKDKIGFLKNGSKTYIKYSESLWADTESLVGVYVNTGVFKIIFSQNTIDYENTLLKYPSGTEYVELVKKALNHYCDDLIKENGGDIGSVETRDRLRTYLIKSKPVLDAYWEDVRASCRKVFKDIFNEEMD